MVRTQLYIITQISTYNYVLRPCILTIVRLYCKFNKQLYNMCVGYPTHILYSCLLHLQYNLVGPKHVVVFLMYYSV
jgi:hypothetical protein